jgi:AraC-like DNA-binding protein
MSIPEMTAIGQVTQQPLTISGPYVTDSYVLVWMDEGETVVVLDGESIQLDARSLVLTPPGGRVEYPWDPRSVQMGYLHFQDPRAAPRPRFYRLDEDSIVPPLLRHIRWLAFEGREGWDAEGQSLFRYALRALDSGRWSTRGTINSALSPQLERVLRFLAAEWYQQPTRAPRLTELAASANLSREYLSRIFTTELGIPPLATLRLLRLSRAASLLRGTNLTVRAVAEQCGFSNEFHFSTTFRDYAGVSPSSFRESGAPVPALPVALRPLARFLFGEDLHREYPAPSRRR